MAEHPPVLKQSSPGWVALLPGFIPALLFVAVHGTRRSYEFLQTTIASLHDSMGVVSTSFDGASVVGIPVALVAGSPAIWARRHSRRRMCVDR